MSNLPMLCRTAAGTQTTRAVPAGDKGDKSVSFRKHVCVACFQSLSCTCRAGRHPSTLGPPHAPPSAATSHQEDTASAGSAHQCWQHTAPCVVQNSNAAANSTSVGSRSAAVAFFSDPAVVNGRGGDSASKDLKAVTQ
jgi:hypothetical protein